MKTMRKMALSAFAAALVAVSAPVWADPVAPQQVAQAAPAPNSANRFNRLMKAAGVEANAPQSTDGIHDPINPGTDALQPPREAFGELPKSNAGNRIDWVKSLQSGAITPRVDIADPNKQKQVMDLDIIREVKGSMPDVVYPHKQHTEWLDCAQCHPKIFVPKKGGNAISMAAILMGQYCGACHGKVAFPVSECTKCHSRPKAAGTTPMRSEAVSVPVQPVAAAAPPPAPVPAPAPAPVVVAPVAAAPVAAPAPAAPAPAAPSVKLTKDQLMKTGKAVYADNCSGCHGEKGEGTPGTFPALKGSKIVKGPAIEHVKRVVKGVADTAMQAWGESMSDEDIAAVVTFERNSFGNNMGDIVQPADVKAVR
ncbi:MAG: c-type cytochrome [Magnetospirillum sp.]|nr:c-type cytochrome [Magnetospirillum sp.]